jgi:hypothetical protein
VLRQGRSQSSAVLPLPDLKEKDQNLIKKEICPILT